MPLPGREGNIYEYCLHFKNVIINDLMYCKCRLCKHESSESCINGHCYCCNLEDMFSIMSQNEFEPPQSRVVAKEDLNEVIQW
jgi:hypothetical protein